MKQRSKKHYFIGSTPFPLLLILLLQLGCSTTPEYRADRRADLTDVVHVDFTFMSFGAAAYVGPAVIGAHAITGPDGYGLREMLGLGGTEEIETSGVHAGFIFPFTKYESDTRSSDKNYASDSDPGYGAIGFDAGFLFGFGARVDFVELIDFVAGFAKTDILKDDNETQYAEAVKETEVRRQMEKKNTSSNAVSP